MHGRRFVPSLRFAICIRTRDCTLMSIRLEIHLLTCEFAEAVGKILTLGEGAAEENALASCDQDVVARFSAVLDFCVKNGTVGGARLPSLCKATVNVQNMYVPFFDTFAISPWPVSSMSAPGV